MLKKFLVLDILLIFVIGGGILFLLVSEQVRLPVEQLSFSIIIWNFGVVGLVSLYHRVPPTVHRFYLAILNTIMVCTRDCCLQQRMTRCVVLCKTQAIMLLVTVTEWILFFFVFVTATLGANSIELSALCVL